MKFNTTNTMKTTNRNGFTAYSMSNKEKLTTAVLTTMFGEPKFYGSTDSEIVTLATNFCKRGESEFVAKLAAYARNVMNMRSVSHVLTCIIARNASKWTRDVVRNVVVRPDDMTEIMACYATMYGKPFPNALKRAMAKAMLKFNAHAYAKYNGGNKEIKFRDMLRIVHPVPNTPVVEKTFSDILNDSLPTPYTWEVELSTRGNNATVWNELIASGKVGYMALLRNLHNIVKCGADIRPVLAKLSNPDEVKKSRQLPFRYLSAYRTLSDNGCMTRDIHSALAKALDASIANMETIPGRTLIAVDVSGSMTWGIASRSKTTCCDIASLFGAMASKICEDADVCYFSKEFRGFGSRSQGYRMAHYGKYESALEIAVSNDFNGGGTDISLPMKVALSAAEIALHPYDRIIYFSDKECNAGFQRGTQALINEYRKRYNPNFWAHGVDLQGYGTQQFCGEKTNLIAGWSETVLKFISSVENGNKTMIQEIEAYSL